MEISITKELIFKHFSCATSQMQKKAIEEWLQEHKNEEKYYEWLEEWERLHMQYQADEEKVIHLLLEDALENNFIKDKTNNPSTSFVHETHLPTYWKLLIAGMVVLACLVGFFHETLFFRTYSTDYHQVARIILPDSSIVKLNANSQMKVLRWGFGKPYRKVRIIGDAWFDVKHTYNNTPFTVITPKGIEVFVYGTEFTVYGRNLFSKVILESGSIEMSYPEENTRKKLHLKPGDMVSFDKENKVRVTKTEQAKEYSNWEQKQFIFESTSLEEIAHQIYESYGIKIHLTSEELAQRTIIGSFRANNIDELLEAISDLLGTTIIRKENSIYLSDLQ